MMDKHTLIIALAKHLSRVATSLCPATKHPTPCTLLMAHEQTTDDYDIDAIYAPAAAAQSIITAEANRKAAYIAEADPLFFKAQRGEATMQEWQDKVAEIKARYPKEGGTPW
jgi:hypothetical protein